MQKYIAKAHHNEDFHSSISEKFSKQFFDWKVVCLFYSAIHYLKAFGSKVSVSFGDTHVDINNNINPKSHTRIYDLPGGMWEEYYALYKGSKNARYEGITVNPETFEELMKYEYHQCLKHFSKFKMFIKSASIPTK